MRSNLLRRPALLSALAALAFASAIGADDLAPAPYRGEPLSTAAQWQFLTDQGTTAIQPDGTEVPLTVGSAKAALDAAFPAGAAHPSAAVFGDISWTGNMSDGGYRGGSAGTAAIAFNVPAWLSTMETATWVRVQIVWTGPPPSSVVFGILGVPGSGDGVTETRIAEKVELDPGLPSGGSHRREDWLVVPDVDWFQVAVFVPFGTFVDGVIIESIDSSVAWSNGIFADGVESGDTSAWSASVP